MQPSSDKTFYREEGNTSTYIRVACSSIRDIYALGTTKNALMEWCGKTNKKSPGQVVTLLLPYIVTLHEVSYLPKRKKMINYEIMFDRQTMVSQKKVKVYLKYHCCRSCLNRTD